jgi:hypothetical protein
MREPSFSEPSLCIPDNPLHTVRSDPLLTLPDDVRAFIQTVTLHLQASRSKTPEQHDAMFRAAYRLYTKYDVEGRRANKAVG